MELLVEGQCQEGLHRRRLTGDWPLFLTMVPPDSVPLSIYSFELLGVLQYLYFLPSLA
jgi:hypothetical protein